MNKDEKKNLSINVPITNGEGTVNLLDGSYNTSATVAGYDSTTFSPKQITVKADVTVYDFTIASTGTLTLHVSEDGTQSGTAVVGAKFVRCDSLGNTYGDEIVSNEQGNAVFQNVPYDASNPPTIYYKQTASDGNHTFDDKLQSTTMQSETSTIEITNAPGALRTFKLTDANYANLPIEVGTITVSD